MKKSQIGTKIAELRLQKGMTQKELADLCNVDIRTIQRIESGEVIPRMHTVKLLSNALEYNLNQFYSSTESDNKTFKKQIHLSYVAGIIFAINYILVAYNSITQVLPIFITLLVTSIHIVTCIFSLKGFYLVAQQYKNQLLATSTLLGMILLPVIAILDSLKSFGYGLFMGMTVTVLAVVCLNAIICGVGMFIQGQKIDGIKANIYKVCGLVTILQSLLILSGHSVIMIIGSFISVFSTTLSVSILYLEYNSLENFIKKETFIF